MRAGLASVETEEARPRIAAIDILRGLIIVIMALDHVRSYTHISGYGLDADASRGVRLIRQTSTAPGYAAAILMAPEFHTGVVVLTNRDGSSAITIAQKLLERSLPVRFPQSLAIVK